MRYFASIVKVSNQDVRQILEQVDLTSQTNQIAATLSGGQLARLSLAVALLGKANVLVLDEPTVGLDPVLRRDLWKLFNRLADEGRTLLISSHVMDEAEQCPDILLLRDGNLLSHGTKARLLQGTKTTSVESAFLKLVESDSHAS
jgi:ABC-2 type transport system ATP-binding protein